MLQMIRDNKIDEVRTILSQQQIDTRSLQQFLQPDSTRCHRNCFCQKCLRLIHSTESNGHVPSENYPDFSINSTLVCNTNGHILSSPDTKDHVTSPATDATLRCHPLCCCDRCSQLVNRDTETALPYIYCRNERGFSGEYLIKDHMQRFFIC